MTACSFLRSSQASLTMICPGGPEFNKITVRTALGFIVMGFIGFFVKLIFIVSALSVGSGWQLSRTAVLTL